MLLRDIEAVGVALCRARQTTRAGHVDLRWVQSMQDARDIQDTAVATLGGTPIGYTLAATTEVTSRLLNCCCVVSGPLLEEFVYRSGTALRLPYGALGIGAQFVFVIGAPVREPLNLRSVTDAIVSCRMGLQLLGRRTAPRFPLDDWSATADFALDAGCILGPAVEGWDWNDLGRIAVSLRIDGNEVATNRGPHLAGDPTHALFALAKSLRSRGALLQAGDVVATGSCTGLVQVVPGQHVEAVFGRWGEVDVRLT